MSEQATVRLSDLARDLGLQVDPKVIKELQGYLDENVSMRLKVEEEEADKRFARLPPKVEMHVNASPVAVEPAPLRKESTLVIEPRHKPGPAPLMKADMEDRAVQVIESGGTMALAAKAVNVHIRTITRHLAENTEFRMRIHEARDLVDDQVEAALFQMAIGKIKTEGKGQVTAMIFWLKNRRPAAWRDAHDLTVRPGDSDAQTQFVLPGGRVLTAASSGLSMARTPK